MLKLEMRAVFLPVILILSFAKAYPKGSDSQVCIPARKNIKAITEISSYTVGAKAFDNRHQGIRGSPMLFDTLHQSAIILKGQERQTDIEADIDLFHNAVVFRYPGTGKMLSVQSDDVIEIMFPLGGKHLKYRTTEGKRYGRSFNGHRFYQVLPDGRFEFIKIPDKLFIEANFKGAYSVERRYDESETINRYSILGNDCVFNQIQLTGRSMKKLFPAGRNLFEATSEKTG